MFGIYIIFSVYCFVIGICVASFINVVIWRVPQGLSIAKGRSFCPTCNHELKWYDLFPIVSYLFLRGKCRYCGAKIPVSDMLIELFGGLIAMFCFYQYQFTFDTIVVFSIFMILLAITMIDFDTMTIPNGLNIALIIPSVILAFLHPEISWMSRLWGVIAISLPMYVLTLIIPDCFGGGDIKLIAVSGLMLGWQNTVLAGFISILIAGIYAVYLLITKKVQKGAHIAFGPYICIGIVISLMYGSTIIQVYASLFGF